MSIYQLERDEDVAELGRLLAESDSVAVRRRSAVALGEITDPADGTVDELVDAARDDPERSVRAGAVDALSEIGEPALRRLFTPTEEPAGTSADDPPVDAYLDALDHEMASMRMAAAAAIGSVGTPGALDGLTDRLDDPHPQVRTRAVRALGRIGDGRAVGPLARLAADGPAKLRAEVATALGEIGAQGAIEPLFHLAEDDDAEVRRRAVVALGRFGRERPVEHLVGRLADGEESVRRAAVFSIVESLSNVPSERSHELRTAVVDALTTSHGAIVTGSLVELFDESAEAHQRRNAAWLLGRVTSDRRVAVETLVAALGDDDGTVRQFAATSLAQMDRTAAEEALLEAIDDSHGDHRSMIVFTLGMVGSQRSRERLVGLLDETDDVEVQERILSALSKLGGTAGGTNRPDEVAER